MRAGPFAARAAILAPVIGQVFDLAMILRVSVGPRWAEFSPEQQNTLLAAFTRYTIANYAANFASDDGTKFEILPDTLQLAADLAVSTRIIPPEGEPVRIDYVMHQTPGRKAWQVVDVLYDGTISQVAVQRSDFRKTLADGGAAGLIALLTRKAASLESGGKS